MDTVTEEMVNNHLRMKIERGRDLIVITWLGRSVDREPGRFITPILARALKEGSGAGKQIVMDFRGLEYMNSSTITPVIKALDRAKRGEVKMVVLYDRSLKWQDLNFSALRIFETGDKRVEIKGL